MPEFLVRLLLGLLFVALRVQFWPLCKLMGYRHFEPKPDSVLVTCCTNGLGHVHQMERVLGVLEDAGVNFPVIALASEKKVPAYKLASLKERFPNTRFVNLDFEVDYDNGKSFKNSAIVWNAAKTTTTRSVQLSRKAVALMKQYQPAYCLSFWEPSIASILDVMNAPTKLVAVASQGQIYRDNSGAERGLLMRGLHQLCVGSKGKLVPLSVLPMEEAIPQIVSLPPAAEEDTASGGYYVAYTTVPQVLYPIRSKLINRRILLFVKEKRVQYYKRKYAKYKHVEVRPTSPEFAKFLAASRGLIATPSRGVVTQAIAAAKPVYLFCPRGHIEQEYNLRFYLQNFAAVTAPRTWRYRRILRLGRAGKVPDGWSGQLMTLADWDESHASRAEARMQQADGLIRWLDQTDELIKTRLMPMITPTAGEVQTMAAAAAQGGAELGSVNATGAGAEVDSGSHLDPSEAAWVEEALSEVRESEAAAPTTILDEEEGEEEEDEEEEEGEESQEEEEEEEGGESGHDEPPALGMPAE